MAFNLSLLFAGLLFLLLFLASVEFFQEKEIHAFKKSLALAILLPSPFLMAVYFHSELLVIILNSILCILIVLLLFTFKSRSLVLSRKPLVQYDERNIMFSRNELIPGSDKYKEYYHNYPEKEKPDNKFRKEPGLLSPKSKYHHPLFFKKADQIFTDIKKLHPLIDGKINSIKTSLPVTNQSFALKKLAIKLGALNVGITELHSNHLYSHKGRGAEYGKEIKTDHKYAIAFTVEMDYKMVKAAPKASIVLESAKQYHKAAQIAIKIAENIRNLGYSAKAHIDGNYELICPLVARDAGLGEIGRMGLLMTPKHGPRVRIGVITTNLELTPNLFKPDTSIEQFCLLCKKCANCCPGKSIPNTPPIKVDGIKRWQINSESCFTYWCKAGTDCGRCMSVCPYSHPNSLMHNFIRRGIKNNPIFRRLAVILDDFFYGKKPKSKKLPKSLL